MKTAREDQLVAALLNPVYDNGIRTLSGLAAELGWDTSELRAAVKACPDTYEYDSSGDRLRIRRSAVTKLPPDRLNKIGQAISV